MLFIIILTSLVHVELNDFLLLVLGLDTLNGKLICYLLISEKRRNSVGQRLKFTNLVKLERNFIVLERCLKLQWPAFSNTELCH